MKVLKFGGTSVGSAKNIAQVADILAQDPADKLVVLSAMSGVTNLLVNFYDSLLAKDRAAGEILLATVKQKHEEAIEELFSDNQAIDELYVTVSQYLGILRGCVDRPISKETYATVVTTGEMMSTTIVSRYLESLQLPNIWLDAGTFMYVNQVENPDIDSVADHLLPQLKARPAALYITQGFVCRQKEGLLTTLNRGGSDFSATIIAAALAATEVEIWTDIDGLHNNDPRYVEETKPIEHLTYNEAAELAYFGAKILHPQTVAPVIDKDIPVWLKNTFDPSAAGTKISNQYHDRGLKAISAKDGITVIKIRSNRMLGAHGFLKTIFEVFDRHETSIDMITTSEVAISLTIDDHKNLNAIVTELAVIAEITVEQDHSIICIVGEKLIADEASANAFGLLKELPVRMISYGGSNNNISLLVPGNTKIKALQYLNQALFSLQGSML
ncbi:MAG: aspartate kinase [Leeuwenhoekiella sp.]